ncbi:hypothetical protein RB623_29860 [Mesorhizobium sp. LHD-90]|uniref:hypothetical protein n=1 Tax=Mesorhizobium sp. LHD-90 TaxID=3071414 RepID=UPI0027DFC3D3|nr:hypothetical protein [Mesorhizobium sp. LHD-90]MDQ6438273.1 hypothetical protein [Mesorhizobium sp. LHD-90]
MSEDPETARQIAELSLDTRPLLVLDVDDVLMEFIRPFMLFLDAQGLELTLATFRLHGNIRHKKTGEVLDREPVSALIDSFFAAQAEWQTPLDGAVDAIAGLARNAEIVMLTAMPHRHRATRRAHLDLLGLPYPLLTTETAKGPAIRALRGATSRPVAFVDDIPHNLISVRAAVSEAHLFHLMAMPAMRLLLPPLPENIEIVDDWREAEPRIAAALGL